MEIKIDVLVAEIGSTTTVVNAFDGIGKDPVFVGSGQAPTTVQSGDVRDGLARAMESLAKNLGAASVGYGKMLAASSAAGGLRMSVHGLVYDMTARAGREAALGAGANIQMTTAGLLDPLDIAMLERAAPNLVLLAGGTDYGERETAAKNAEALAASRLSAPVIYCGNAQNAERVRMVFGLAGKKLYVTENVYPRLDELNVEPVRRLIHRAFEEHITEAPGMAHVRDMVTGSIIPTPGAVMEAAKLLRESIGDALVVDVGGATTDVHSVSEGSEEMLRMAISPEPFAKRTVEGDLGVYVNAAPLAAAIGHEKIAAALGLPLAALEAALAEYRPIPETAAQFAITSFLAEHAAAVAIRRHAGRLRHTFVASGRKTWAEGKDLTKVKWLVATGGALTRLPARGEILGRLTGLNENGELLYPAPGSMSVLEDSSYIMAALGVLSLEHREDAKKLAEKELF